MPPSSNPLSLSVSAAAATSPRTLLSEDKTNHDVKRWLQLHLPEDLRVVDENRACLTFDVWVSLFFGSFVFGCMCACVCAGALLLLLHLCSLSRCANVY